MRTTDFDFSLPDELIAQFPPSSRSSSRLLHLDGASGQLADRLFTDLQNDLSQALKRLHP